MQLLLIFAFTFYMLKKALNFLKEKLNTAISDPAQPASVILTSIVNERGEVNIQSGQLAIMLVNLEEEKILKMQLPHEKRVGNNIQFANPEIKLNLLVMLAANPGADNYLAALDTLSQAMLFFQGTSFFDKIKYPALAPEIEKLTLELFSLTLEQQNQLWASLGAKYLPSAIYKIRLVVVDQELFGESKPLVKVIDNNLKKIS